MKIVGILVVALAIDVAVGLLSALPVMLLWNAFLVPAIFVHPIGWVQAWGIMILLAILCRPPNVNVSASKD